MKKIATFLLALVISMGCTNKKAQLVERRGFATEALKNSKMLDETSLELFRNGGNFNIDSLEKAQHERAKQQVEYEHLIDSCNDELDKLK